MAQRQGIRTMVLVFETDPGNFRSSDTHIMDRISNALAQVKNVHIGLAFYDENGHRLRKVELTELGEASPQMKSIMEVELAVEDEARGA